MALGVGPGLKLISFPIYKTNTENNWQNSLITSNIMSYLFLTLILPICIILKMSSAYYICCIYSNAPQNISTLEADTINPAQTAPRGAGAV